MAKTLPLTTTKAVGIDKMLYPRIEEYFRHPHRKDLKPKLFISRISIGDKREVLQGDGHSNQVVALCITPEIAQRFVTAVNAHDALLAAAERVLAGLHARIEKAAANDEPHPVFDGIGDLYAAVSRAKGWGEA
jgi:hypothetical protein